MTNIVKTSWQWIFMNLIVYILLRNCKFVVNKISIICGWTYGCTHHCSDMIQCIRSGRLVHFNMNIIRYSLHCYNIRICIKLKILSEERNAEFILLGSLIFHFVDHLFSSEWFIILIILKVDRESLYLTVQRERQKFLGKQIFILFVALFMWYCCQHFPFLLWTFATVIIHTSSTFVINT